MECRLTRKGTKPGQVDASKAPGNASAFAERERDAIEALGAVPETPSSGAPDTVKLTSQTWQPPPRKGPEKPSAERWDSAQQTVKVTTQTWREVRGNDEEAVTDIREVPADLDAIVTGEANPQVAGEIGTDEDQPVRIVSVPPIDPSSLVLPLPGMTAPVSTPEAPTLRVNKPRPPPSVRDPTPPPHTQKSAGSAPPQRQMTPTPLPAAPRAPFGLEPTPVPRRSVDPTMMIRVQRSPVRLVVAASALSALVGLGAGYAIWGIGQSRTDSAEAAPAPGAEQAAKPAVVTAERCSIEIASTPKGATVSMGETELGQTPVKADVKCGPVDLTLKKRRYASKTEKVVVTAGAPNKVSLELERPTHTIMIKSSPSGATIKRGGEELGKTPMKIELPGYTKTALVLKRKGYRKYSVNVTARKKSSSASFKLKRK